MKRTRPSSWEVFDDDGHLVGDIHSVPGQYDAILLSGKVIGTYKSLGAAARAVVRAAAAQAR